MSRGKNSTVENRRRYSASASAWVRRVMAEPTGRRWAKTGWTKMAGLRNRGVPARPGEEKKGGLVAFLRRHVGVFGAVGTEPVFHALNQLYPDAHSSVGGGDAEADEVAGLGVDREAAAAGISVPQEMDLTQPRMTPTICFRGQMVSATSIRKEGEWRTRQIGSPK
ncbi:hypothetical protein HPP92_012933 [Vanilla planifolia]|uniref:Uncharacterized protein n=1 Tax=Vanilla planifolia TaxID=51239 RepID=A0A835QXS4_VANPL|nr:hypothetical protein HPP92_012933 [Vanilla planifolia]